MKPFQILLYLISVFLILLIPALLIPESGIKVPGQVTLHFISVNEIFDKKETNYADVNEIINQSSVANEAPKHIPSSGLTVLPSANNSFYQSDQIREETSGNSGESDEPAEVPENDSVTSPAERNVVGSAIKADADSLRNITFPIEFPQNDPSLLSQLFLNLHELKVSRKLLRILHYGDSQIEADRMTSYIRDKMQLKFGGSGCGLIPAVPLYNGKVSIKQDYSSNWIRYTGFANQDHNLGHEKFGPLFSFSSYRPFKSNSAEKAWLEFSPSTVGYKTSRRFNNISLYMGGGTAEMKIYVNDSIYDFFDVPATNEFTKFNWQIPVTPREFRIELSGNAAAEIYGISLDNNWGVAVDNIPLRGSSGLVFSKNDTVFLRKMFRKLNVGMLILQFGGNVVPLMSEDYGYYERFLKRELRVIKKMLPGVPVIIIGPSDMSMKENGKYITYPNLEDVRDAMRKAALESGCAFWDMYLAMGGKNSMPGWVFADPPLAVRDFVHFNPRGARIMGEMFYNALMAEYKSWQIKNRQLTAGSTIQN